jgi:hypothetical protein
MKNIRPLWSAVNCVLAGIAVFFTFNLSLLSAVFIVLAVTGFLGQACYDSRRIRQVTAAIIPTDANVPAPYEIEAAVRRIRRFLDRSDDLSVPDPPGGVDVACEQCEITEHYVYSSNAAESAHLLEHPEVCRVTESEHGAPWLLKPFEARHEKTETVAHA